MRTETSAEGRRYHRGMSDEPSPSGFHGWRVVAGAFVVAVFGWGLGFYGPPIYLHAVRELRGWPVALVSAAITIHYLCGALVVANLPSLYRRFGLARVTRLGSVALAAGLVGWASAREPWQLFLATPLTGGGWVTLGAAAINAIVSPWFVRLRPRALSTAYNGASVGGIIFSPLWVLLIGWMGFQYAAVAIGIVTIAVVLCLTARGLGRPPADFGQFADGEADPPGPTSSASNTDASLSGSLLWKDWRFRTLAAGMALGLFAQIGLLAHFFSLVVPALGDGWAALVAALMTASAILGRTVFGWVMRPETDRRSAAALSYGIQILGIAALIASGLRSPPLIVLGATLVGFGIGNATSLPPLIAQVEFSREETGRVVALVVAIAQASYAFAPAFFGVLRPDSLGGTLAFLATVAAIKLAAAVAYLLGRRGRSLRPPT